jgi:hypothetical protein
MAKQIDGDVWRMMLREKADVGGQLMADPVSLVFVGIDRQRAWERGWTLALPTGERRRVSIMVEESHDSQVAVKVGPNVLDRLAPPWIVHRERGERVDDEQDRRERQGFNQRILDAMERGLERERELEALTHAHRGLPAASGAERTDPR